MFIANNFLKWGTDFCKGGSSYESLSQKCSDDSLSMGLLRHEPLPERQILREWGQKDPNFS